MAHIITHLFIHSFIHPIIWFTCWFNVSLLVYASPCWYCTWHLIFYSISNFVSNTLYRILSQLNFIMSCEVSRTDIIIVFYFYKTENMLKGVSSLPTQDRNTGYQKPTVGHLDPKRTYDLHKPLLTFFNLSYTVCDPNSISEILWIQNPRNMDLCVL